MFEKLNLTNFKASPQQVIAGSIFLFLLSYGFQPFPHLDISFPMRFAFWAGLVVLSISIIPAAGCMMRRWFSDGLFSGSEVTLTLIVIVTFVPALWVIVWLLFTASGQRAPDMASVTPYGVLFAAGFVVVRGRRQNNSRQQGARATQPRLIRRLPSGFDGQIFHLTVRDHMVDVVTSQGTFTIRSRMSDAIAEMEPVAGHCTHRSHWVVDSAVRGVEKQGGKTSLRLRNGDLVPVSRKYRPILEKAGML